MKIEDLDLLWLHPVNSPISEEKVDQLTTSLRHGWSGRPLLVEEANVPGPPWYDSWTGSHRIAAAQKAGLVLVPCALITKEEASSASKRGGYDVSGYRSLRDAVQGLDGPYDSHKLAALEKLGLREAADLMRAEIEDNQRPMEGRGDA